MAPLTLALEAAALRSEVGRLGVMLKAAMKVAQRAQAENQALRDEKELLESERDTALYELEREQQAHSLHHDRGPR